MARPRKADADELIQLVDSYFTTEAAGDPSKLKCSFLERFAARNGKDIKAYDFRRYPEVRERMEELKAMVLNENGMQMLKGNSYKSLDIASVLKARRDPDELRKVLGEMDAYWKQVYEKCISLSRENMEFQNTIRQLKNDNSAFAQSVQAKETDTGRILWEKNKLAAENRYLRKMLKTYLYPAVANEILKQENLLENPDTEVTEAAMERMADVGIPASFSETVSADRKMRSREEELLQRMWKETGEM